MNGTSKALIAALGAVLMTPAIAGAQNIYVTVNGEQVAFPGVGPMQVNGRVLVPLRGVLEKLGAYVGYEGATKTVTANKSGTDLQLRLGERQAMVNGRVVTLDVPAQTYRGSTMVPLRFVGEALGADVRWNAATYTVDITTVGSGSGNQQIDPNNYQPPGTGTAGTGNVAITSFDVDQTGLLRGGSTMRFTLQGTPGGSATFSIPGVVTDVPMTESQPGVYTGSFNVPSNSPITVSKASAIARLRVGNTERLIQAGSSIGFDNQSPLITSVTPDPSSRVTRPRPNISAIFDDASGSGVDTSTVELRVDNRIVTNDAQVTSTFVSYRPEQALTGGMHEVTLTARDKAGNPVTKTWAFQVSNRSDVIRSFEFDSNGQALTPGTEVTFTMLAEPGGTATFTVGDRVRERKMTETSPGRYVGTYTIRRNDNFEDTVVTAKLVTASNETYTMETANRITTNVRSLEKPAFESPAANERVGNNVVLRGRAAPGSRVQIRIDYTKNVLGAFRMNGTVGEFEVTADDRGNFVTDRIDLNTGLGSGDTTYTVTAVSLGANGRKSDPVTLTLKK